MTDEIQEAWRRAWPGALAAWSSFTKLSEPIWCLSRKDEKAAELSGSFAMIRLADHKVVISLRQIEDMNLTPFATEILAHEIGHHVYAPGDLRDAGRLLARMRLGLPTREIHAPMISNLYTDLLINDRLQRQAGLNIVGVYEQIRALEEPSPSKLWACYMRTYEILWNRERGSLANPDLIDEVQLEAELGARLVRSYARDWMRGGGRFACLMLRFLLENEQEPGLPGNWLDALSAGAGAGIPDGLADLDDDELDGIIHPAFDPELSGLDVNLNEVERDRPTPGGRTSVGGQKGRYRNPGEYTELLKSLGVDLPLNEVVSAYYRERASRHIIRFPRRRQPQALDPHPEGLDVWDPSSPIAAIDWVESVIRSPLVIPGVTTVERQVGHAPGGEPAFDPVDLYLGIDCSGSMGNPAVMMSFPVLSGAIMLLSALRAKANVMVCLSGEPGTFSQTDGFIRDERKLMATLTHYLGTGYAFGIKRLEDEFMVKPPPKRATHALIISDADMFVMIRDVPNGTEIIETVPKVCSAGATMVLQLQRAHHEESIAMLEKAGWNVHTVTTMEEVVTFAAAFSRKTWERHGSGTP
ncbi:MAG: VWA domain-containing protein [bacterium]